MKQNQIYSRHEHREIETKKKKRQKAIKRGKIVLYYVYSRTGCGVQGVGGGV